MSEPEAKRRLMQQLSDRFINDPGFRKWMRQDPEGTAERFSGVQLPEEVGKPYAAWIGACPTSS
jgi:hypothetical protein